MSDSQYSELVKYISAMIQEIGDFRKEVKQEIDALRKEVKQEIDALRTETLEGFDKVETRLAKVEEDIKEIKQTLRIISQDLMTTRKYQVSLEDRIELLEQRQS